MRLEQRFRLKIPATGGAAVLLLGLSACGTGAVDVSPPAPEGPR